MNLFGEVVDLMKNEFPYSALTEEERRLVVLVGLRAMFGTIQQRAVEGKATWVPFLGVFDRGTLQARSYTNPRDSDKKIQRGKRHFLRFRAAREFKVLALGREVETVK